MKRGILFLAIVFILSCHSGIYAQNTNTSPNKPKVVTLYKNNIYFDPLFLIFGSKIIGYEYRIFKRLSIYGSYGFGKISFVEIKKFYEFGFQYFFKPDFNKGFHFKIYVNETGLKTEQKEADVFNYFLGVGHRWIVIKKISIDAFLGIYMSNKNNMKFEKVDGNTIKTVNIGGFRQSGSIRIGFCF